VSRRAVLPQCLTVVRSEDHDRTLVCPPSGEVVQNPRQLAIGERDLAVVEIRRAFLPEELGSVRMFHIRLMGVEIVQPEKPRFVFSFVAAVIQPADRLVGDQLGAHVLGGALVIRDQLVVVLLKSLLEAT
jgi:hypothetical protein